MQPVKVGRRRSLERVSSMQKVAGVMGDEENGCTTNFKEMGSSNQYLRGGKQALLLHLARHTALLQCRLQLPRHMDQSQLSVGTPADAGPLRRWLCRRSAIIHSEYITC